MAHEASWERQWLEHSRKLNIPEVLFQSNNLNVLSLVRIFFSFLFLFAALPYMSFEFTNLPLNVQNDAQVRINGQIMHNTESSTFERTSLQRLYCTKILKQTCYPSISLRQLC